MEEECIVYGALATLLCLLRMLGLLPVRLIPVSADAFIVRYSFAQDIIARLLYGCLSFVEIILAVVHGINKLSSNDSIKQIIESLMTDVCLIIRIALIFAVVSKGYQRTKQLFKNLDEIQKLNIEGIHMDDVAVANVEKRRQKLFFCLLMVQPIIHITEILVITLIILREIDYLYFFRQMLNLFGLFVILLLEAQFVFTTLTVHSALQALNRHLGKLLTDFKINKDRSNEISSAHRTLRGLATSYNTLCDVMRTLDEENGPMILIIFLLLLFHASQYILLSIVFWNTSLDLINIIVILMLIIHICHFVYFKLQIMFLLEPCQWAYNEMEVSRLFVTRLTHYAPTLSGPLVIELEIFYHLVFTNIPSYSPFQLFTLKRSLISQIVGALASWMLIVFHETL